MEKATHRKKRRGLYGRGDAKQMKVLLVSLYLVLVLYSIVVLFEGTLILSDNCSAPTDSAPTAAYSNPDYDTNPCLWVRSPTLLYLTPLECDLSRRLVVSVFLGGCIGWERRESDRPAGIRTMSLVTLGSCLFTITSMFSFQSGPMSWDASRVAAAIPSGVGFLGAGLIWKGEVFVDDGNGKIHQVHGLTTAASVWLSAAVGVAVGGRLYFIALYTVTLIIVILRFGPRLMATSDAASEEDEDESVATENRDDLGDGEEEEILLRSEDTRRTRNDDYNGSIALHDFRGYQVSEEQYHINFLTCKLF